MMTTLPTAPTTTRVKHDKDRLLVVCSKMAFTTQCAEGNLLEQIGATFLHQLLEMSLRFHGVALSAGDERGKGTAFSLHRALAIFTVRDVAAATDAIRPVLENSSFGAFFAIGYFDKRESIWRATWQPKRLFDLHQHVTELIRNSDRDTAARLAVLKQVGEKYRQQFNLPPGEPPTDPAA
jgi:hypothetical protein